MCVSLFVKFYVTKVGWTPLFDAVNQGNINVVKYLVKEAKVNPSQTDMVLSLVKEPHTLLWRVFLEWCEPTRAFVS